MLIRNVKSHHDLEIQKKLQAELLQMQIDNEELQEKRVSDYRNPNKPPPIPPQYRTAIQIQKDSLVQQKEVIDNLRSLGLEFTVASQISQDLSKLPDGDANFLKFNRNFPLIKKDLSERFKTSELDAQSIMGYVQDFFSEIDSSIGISIRDSTSTNFFDSGTLQGVITLPSAEDYRELSEKIIDISDNLEEKISIGSLAQQTTELFNISPSNAELRSIDDLPNLERRRLNKEVDKLIKTYKLPTKAFISKNIDDLNSLLFEGDQIEKEFGTTGDSPILERRAQEMLDGIKKVFAVLQRTFNSINVKSQDALASFTGILRKEEGKTIALKEGFEYVNSKEYQQIQKDKSQAEEDREQARRDAEQARRDAEADRLRREKAVEDSEADRLRREQAVKDSEADRLRAEKLEFDLLINTLYAKLISTDKSEKIEGEQRFLELEKKYNDLRADTNYPQAERDGFNIRYKIIEKLAEDAEEENERLEGLAQEAIRLEDIALQAVEEAEQAKRDRTTTEGEKRKAEEKSEQTQRDAVEAIAQVQDALSASKIALTKAQEENNQTKKMSFLSKISALNTAQTHRRFTELTDIYKTENGQNYLNYPPTINGRPPKSQNPAEWWKDPNVIFESKTTRTMNSKGNYPQNGSFSSSAYTVVDGVPTEYEKSPFQFYKQYLLKAELLQFNNPDGTLNHLESKSGEYRIKLNQKKIIIQQKEYDDAIENKIDADPDYDIVKNARIPSQGFGAKLGFENRRIKIGKGIEIKKDEPKYKEFGKYIVHYKQLINDNILNVKYPSTGGIPSIKPVSIDDNFKDFFIDVLDTGRVNQKHFTSLTEPEKAHFSKIIRGAKLTNVLKFNPTDDSTEKDEMNRLELVFGEINAGNDNANLLKEARTLIKKYIGNGRINKNKGLEMLMELE